MQELKLHCRPEIQHLHYFKGAYEPLLEVIELDLDRLYTYRLDDISMRFLRFIVACKVVPCSHFMEICKLGSAY